jgi:hypothetical protein
MRPIIFKLNADPPRYRSGTDTIRFRFSDLSVPPALAGGLVVVRVSGRLKVAQAFKPGKRVSQNKEPALADGRFNRYLHSSSQRF